MNKNQQIHDKINAAIRILCDVYDILHAEEEAQSIKNDSEYGFMTVKQFCNKHTFVNMGSMRDKIYKNPNNFLEKCTTKIGKRIYIREKAFFDWMEENGTSDKK